MKQLTCELCGGNDLVKQDGFFVCQHCATKYSLEEAKKMMIEGTVNVVGTVKIDNTSSYGSIVELAKDSFKDGRFESSYEYYCQAVEIKPNEFENVLRHGLSILAKEGIQANIPSSCISRLDRAIDILKEMSNEQEKDEKILSGIEDLKLACTTVLNKLDEEISALGNQKLQTRSTGDILADLGRPAFVASQNRAEDKRIERHNNSIDTKIYAVCARKTKVYDFRSEYKEKLLLCASINTQFKAFYIDDINKAVELYPNITLTQEEQLDLIEKDDRLLTAVKNANVGQVEMLIKMGADVNKKTDGYSLLYRLSAYGCKEEHLEAKTEIVKILLDCGIIVDGDESHNNRTLLNLETAEPVKKVILDKYPELQNKITTAPSKGGCYVATCVYGSYDCPQVWTLRRYCDNTLGATWYGRAFIRTYYAISPTLVKWFGNTSWFKKMWKGKLDRMVKKLQDQGVESTPYNDKNW